MAAWSARSALEVQVRHAASFAASDMRSLPGPGQHRVLSIYVKGALILGLAPFNVA